MRYAVCLFILYKVAPLWLFITATLYVGARVMVQLEKLKD